MRHTIPDQGRLGRIVSAAGPMCAIAILALTLGCGAARANDIYIAQIAAGSLNGSSCANAFAYGFFNAAANWGAGSNQIGAGTTVHLCGTFTDSLNGTLLTAYGSGATGNPITIQFES